MGKSVSLPQWLEQKIEGRRDNFSEVIKQDLEHYYALLDMIGNEMKGFFTSQEASFICNVFRNTKMDLKRLKSWPDLFVWDIEDVEKYEKLGKKIGLDVEKLIEKLETLTPVHSMWIWDRILMFWKTPGTAEMDAQSELESEEIKKLFNTDDTEYENDN